MPSVNKTLPIGLMLSLINSPTAVSQESEQIVGYTRECSVKLDGIYGTLTAQRSLTEDGAAMIRNDVAAWNPHNGGPPQPSIGVTWWEYRRNGINFLRLSEVEGVVGFYYRQSKRLPPVALWRFKRKNSAVDDSALAAAARTGADKRLTGTKFNLTDLVTFAADAQTLFWTLDRLPSRDGATAALYAGTIETGGLREASNAVAVATASLDVMQLAATEKCERKPIYYDPNAEI